MKEPTDAVRRVFRVRSWDADELGPEWVAGNDVSESWLRLVGAVPPPVYVVTAVVTELPGASEHHFLSESGGDERIRTAE